jgi:predicted nucleotidyltransferase
VGSLDDLKSPLERELLVRCKRAIRAIDPTADVILFGSRARGDAEDDSDYDLLILTDGDSGLKREDLFRQSLYPLVLETGAMLSIMAFNRIIWESSLYREMPFGRNVRKDGVVL